jgi:hypothetical protein
MAFRGKGRFGPRRKPGVMNGLESQYADLLDDRKANGEIERYIYEGVTLTIIDPQTALKARYTPDFAVYLPNGELEFHETKGFLEGDALLKLKAASEKWPHRFVMVKKKLRRDGGGWEYREF